MKDDIALARVLCQQVTEDAQDPSTNYSEFWRHIALMANQVALVADQQGEERDNLMVLACDTLENAFKGD